jgi:hypothetical protein
MCDLRMSDINKEGSVLIINIVMVRIGQPN